jgi:hypothetical protein
VIAGYLRKRVDIPGIVCYFRSDSLTYPIHLLVHSRTEVKSSPPGIELHWSEFITTTNQTIDTMEKYIVLRKITPTTPEKIDGMRGGRPRSMTTSRESGGTPTTSDESRSASFKLEKMTSKELTRLRQLDPPLIAAKAMPLRLIKPLAKKKVKPAAMPEVVWGVEAVNAVASPFDGTGITVAVLDTGIDKKHDAFKGMKITEKDFTGDGNGDKDGHGSHCAGTIFGRDINGTRIGIARGVKNALIGKVIGKDGGSSDMIIEAMQWAISNGAHVISMSLGIDFPGYVEELVKKERLPVALATSMALEDYRANVLLFDAMHALLRQQTSFVSKGRQMVVVAAAGNESRLDVRDDFEIGVGVPAVAEGLVSVAAFGQNGKTYQIAPFSNSGAKIAAPGMDIISAKAGTKAGLVSSDGTSMAGPHVAGVAALWLQKFIDDGRNDEIDSFLFAHCDRSKLPKSKIHMFGAGVVQAPTS